MASFRSSSIVEQSSGSGVTIADCLFKDGVPFGNISWSMYSTAVQLLGASQQQITFNVEDWDTHGSIVDLANNRATVPYSGKYYIAFENTLRETGRYVLVFVRVNGTGIRSHSDYSFALANSAYKPFECLLDLTAGDHVDITMYGYTAINVGELVASASTQGARLTGVFISE